MPYRLLLFLFLVAVLSACGSPNYLENAQEALANGDTNLAIEEYTKAIEEEGVDVETQYAAYVGLAGIYADSIVPKTTEALASYDAALALSPANPSSALLGRAGLNLTEGNYEAVIADLDQLLAIEPNNYTALAMRGEAHLELRNFEEAIADLKASLQGEVSAASADVDAQDDLVSAYYRLGLALLDLGEYEDAIANYTEALSFATDDLDKADVLAARGFAYSEMGQPEMAIADLDQAIALAPDLAIAYAYRSYAHSDLGNYEASIADATEAVNLGTDLSASTRSALLHARATAHLNLEQYEEAIADATESIELEGVDNPDTARTYNIRSEAYRYLGDYEAAVADATKAIEVGSNDVTALGNFYYQRATAYYYMDDYESALADLEASMGVDGPSGVVYEFMGDIYSDLEDYEEAVAMYSSALELESDRPYSLFGRGYSYYFLNQDDLALADLREALKYDLPTDYVDFINELISEMGG